MREETYGDDDGAVGSVGGDDNGEADDGELRKMVSARKKEGNDGTDEDDGVVHHEQSTITIALYNNENQ